MPSRSHEQQFIFHQINKESGSCYSRPRPALPRCLPAFEPRISLPGQPQRQFESLQISLCAAHMISPEDSQTLRALRLGTAQHVNPTTSTPPQLFHILPRQDRKTMRSHCTEARRNVVFTQMHRQCIANASAPLRRGQHLRHFATVARTSAIPWGQASCSCWSLNSHPQSKGFLRSYSLRVNRKPANLEEIDQTPDTKEITPRAPCEDDILTSRKVDKPNSFTYETLADLNKTAEICCTQTRCQGPEVQFDQSDLAPKTHWTEGLTVRPLDGYSSDAARIKMYFGLDFN